jgi:hypothetical protein
MNFNEYLLKNQIKSNEPSSECKNSLTGIFDFSIGYADLYSSLDDLSSDVKSIKSGWSGTDDCSNSKSVFSRLAGFGFVLNNFKILGILKPLVLSALLCFLYVYLFLHKKKDSYS